ncbi:hypothetical protein AAC387_Pa02g3181 [Persea americana]
MGNDFEALFEFHTTKSRAVNLTFPGVFATCCWVSLPLSFTPPKYTVLTCSDSLPVFWGRLRLSTFKGSQMLNDGSCVSNEVSYTTMDRPHLRMASFWSVVLAQVREPLVDKLDLE